ncbi:MAG: NADH-quinone oxidoreductase subunit M [Actinobacteria bacterium]|nr:NADH-quinone oxidoreductase subunit M [Actinomycetota bacterium]
MIAASSEVLKFPILSALIVLPLVGAIVVALLGKSRPEWVKLAALVSSVTTGALSLWLLGAFKSGEAGFQFVSQHLWISQWGISWHLGVDGISLFLVVLTGILFPLVIVGIDPHHNETSYLAWMLLLQAGVMGSFLALDLFLFFVMFEIVLVPMYFLIGGWGYDQRVYAATKFFLYTMAGSAFMLVGIIATVALAQRDLGVVTFDVVKIAEGASFSTNAARWLFVSFAIAFAVKVPLFPFHTKKKKKAVTGAVIQMVNHGVSTGALFLLVGMIYERRHTREIAELRGIQHVAPIFAGVFTVVMLSSVGLPGLNGFVGEFLILIGSFEAARWWTVVATVGVVLAALYLLWAYQRVFHGEPDEANSSFKEINAKEGMLMAVFVAVILVTGIYPKPMLERIEPSVNSFIEHVEGQTK